MQLLEGMSSAGATTVGITWTHVSLACACALLEPKQRMMNNTNVLSFKTIFYVS